MDDGDSDAGPSGERSRRTTKPVVVAVLVGAVIVIAGFAWVRAHPTLQRVCTLAGAVDTPTASSPEAAFDAWWANEGPGAVRNVTSNGAVPEDGQQPTKEDFTRLSDTSWEWRYADRRSVGVDVGRPLTGNAPAGTWAVIGVNQCGYGPVNGGN